MDTEEEVVLAQVIATPVVAVLAEQVALGDTEALAEMVAMVAMAVMEIPQTIAILVGAVEMAA